MLWATLKDEITSFPNSKFPFACYKTKQIPQSSLFMEPTAGAGIHLGPHNTVGEGGTWKPGTTGTSGCCFCPVNVVLCL